MKISGYILIVLMISFCFTLVGNIVYDMNVYYPDINIDTSSWNASYDYSMQINKSISGLQERFEILGDEEKGWFPKLTAGISVIPLVIIYIPTILFDTIGFGTKIMVGVLPDIGIPAWVITYLIIAMFITILFASAAYIFKGGQQT